MINFHLIKFITKTKTKLLFFLPLPRSVHGYMHIKIENHENFYTLGIFYKPFPSVSELIYYYSLNKLPLRNVELSLLFPLKDQLL